MLHASWLNLSCADVALSVTSTYYKIKQLMCYNKHITITHGTTHSKTSDIADQMIRSEKAALTCKTRFNLFEV